MDIQTFQNLPRTQIAQLVQSSGPRVCVFPINGTRRWFMLEQPAAQDQDFASAYIDVITRRHIALYQLFFEHGLDTLLTPCFGPDLIERGPEYMQMAAEGLARLVRHTDFLAFYQAQGVRVRFYGDYRRYFDATPYAYLSDMFDELTAQTAAHERYRLFFGLFAHDASERIGELAIRHHAQHGCPPDKRALVELYYGEYVGPANLFIGFDRFSAFDMPLIATGNEDLYFTVSPSPYMTERQLRDILYDHLYARHADEPEYEEMTPQDWAMMRDFYHANRECTLGVGKRQGQDGFWYPLPQVKLPDSFRS